MLRANIALSRRPSCGASGDPADDPTLSRIDTNPPRGRRGGRCGAPRAPPPLSEGGGVLAWVGLRRSPPDPTRWIGYSVALRGRRGGRSPLPSVRDGRGG